MARPKKTQQAPTEDTQQDATTYGGMTGDELIAMLDRKVGESESHWNSGRYKLKDVDKQNTDWYYGTQHDDETDEDTSRDNRIFSSMRTVMPYTTNRITEPEVYPSSKKPQAKRFSDDFEKALHTKARKEKVKMKLRFALEDAVVRRRGYLKCRYDPTTGNFCKVEYIPAESIIIDHKARPGEEPRYFRHKQEKSADDLLTMFADEERFPGAKARILEAFGLDENMPKEKFQEDHDISEDWVFVSGDDGSLDLLVCWHYDRTYFGIIQDPNWRYEQMNFWEQHMMPLVFLNVLSDGRGYVDPTSYVEQAKAPQRTVDERSKQIGDNAGLGSIGMPVVAAGALAEDQEHNLDYEPNTAIILDIENSGLNRIQDAFDTWKAEPLSPDVYKDKVDAIAAVQNAFGASSVQQGQESDNNTLGQDALLRDQSMGRQQEIVEAIDEATERLYLIMAQFLLVYGDEAELFCLVGENGDFDYIIMNSSELDTNAEIHVKSGTSMPIDNVQRRAMAKEAAAQGMIDPLTFWEINDEPNAQRNAKRFADWNLNPQAFMQDAEEEVFDRDAFVDIELVKQGAQPPYRESPAKEYFDYLNKFILDGNLNPENPELSIEQKQMLGMFIDQQLVRGQQMLGMMETQLPTPEEVNSHNESVNEQNAADAEVMKAMPPPEKQPAGASK